MSFFYLGVAFGQAFRGAWHLAAILNAVPNLRQNSESQSKFYIAAILKYTDLQTTSIYKITTQ